jgi:hypothetical protein
MSAWTFQSPQADSLNPVTVEYLRHVMVWRWDYVTPSLSSEVVLP